jgi:hypothetical protein
MNTFEELVNRKAEELKERMDSIQKEIMLKKISNPAHKLYKDEIKTRAQIEVIMEMRIEYVDYAIKCAEEIKKDLLKQFAEIYPICESINQ